MANARALTIVLVEQLRRDEDGQREAEVPRAAEVMGICASNRSSQCARARWPATTVICVWLRRITCARSAQPGSKVCAVRQAGNTGRRDQAALSDVRTLC